MAMTHLLRSRHRGISNSLWGIYAATVRCGRRVWVYLFSFHTPGDAHFSPLHPVCCACTLRAVSERCCRSMAVSRKRLRTTEPETWHRWMGRFYSAGGGAWARIAGFRHGGGFRGGACPRTWALAFFGGAVVRDRFEGVPHDSRRAI